MIEKECKGKKCPFIRGFIIGKNCHRAPKKPCINFDTFHEECKILRNIDWKASDVHIPSDDSVQ